MLHSVNVLASSVATSFPEARSNCRFDLLAALKHVLETQGVKLGVARQQTPSNAVLGYVQQLAFQGKEFTLKSVIGESDRLALRFTVTDATDTVLFSYLLRLGESQSITDVTWEQFEVMLAKRKDSLSVFSGLLTQALEKGSFLH